MPSSARGRSQQRQSLPNNLQDKLRKREDLIVSFKGSADANKGTLRSRHGKTGARSLENMSTLVDSNHIEIAELKDHFKDETNSVEYQRLEMELLEVEVPELPFGFNNYAPKQDILTSVPARPIVDRLVNEYLKVMDMVPGKSFV